MRNFAVTGLGRSGTRFLAEILNRSQEWTVLHEPGGCKPKIFEQVQARFVDWYGEVNSYLVEYLDMLTVERKAIIIRNPRDVVLSTYNRRKCRLGYDLDVIRNKLLMMDCFIRRGMYTIWFEQMVSDVNYLQSITHHLGISDVTVGKDDIQRKMNRNRTYYVHEYNDIDKRTLEESESKVGWFVEEYYC